MVIENTSDDDEDEPDPRPAVLAYLERRKCGVCRASLESVTIADVLESSVSPAFRCFPPAPSCWNLLCKACGQQIMMAVRKGKAWPVYPAKVSRRSPKRRAKV